MYPPNSRAAGTAGGVIVTSTESASPWWLWPPPIVTVGALNVTVAKAVRNDGANVFAPVESAGSWVSV